MLGLNMEFADRFIEFAVKRSKGDTIEERLTAALNTCGYFFAVGLFIMSALIVTNLYLRIELSSAEDGLMKVGVLIDGRPGSPIHGFLTMNEALAQQLTVTRAENLNLIRTNIQLMEETTTLRFQLVEVLERTHSLKRNNDLLVEMCTPKVNP